MIKNKCLWSRMTFLSSWMMMMIMMNDRDPLTKCLINSTSYTEYRFTCIFFLHPPADYNYIILKDLNIVPENKYIGNRFLFMLLYREIFKIKKYTEIKTGLFIFI